MKRSCGFESGVDLPFRQAVSDKWIAAAKKIGMDWIYVEQSVVNKDLVARAHRGGVQVLAYTVNRLDALGSWATNPPDAVITDRIGLVNEWAELNSRNFVVYVGY